MDVFDRFRSPGDIAGRQQKARGLTESGIAHLTNDNPRRAAADLRKAVALDPANAKSYEYLAQALFRLEEYEAADEQLGIALRLEPNDAQLHASRGQILEQLDRIDDAREEFTTASTVDPTDGMVALAAFELRRNNPVKAEALAVQVLKRDERNVEGWRVLAATRESQGDTATAIQSVEWVLTLRPDDRGAQCALAGLMEKQGDVDRAIDLLQAANRNGPCDDQVLQSLGRVLAKRGRMSDAETLYKEVIDRLPADRKMFYQAQLTRLKSEFGGTGANFGSNPWAAMMQARSSKRGTAAPPVPESAPRRQVDDVQAGAGREDAASDHAGPPPPRSVLEQLSRSRLPRLIGAQRRPTGADGPGETPPPVTAVAASAGPLPAVPALPPAETPTIPSPVKPPPRRVVTITQLEYEVSRDPSNSKLRRDLSILYLQAGRIADAKEQARRAEALQSRRSAVTRA